MFDVQLLVNLSERQRINKSINAGPTLSGVLRDTSSVIDPVITVEYPDVSIYNYAYIPLFWGRYYYILNVTSVRNGLWELTMHTDPLMSYRTQLMGVQCIIDASTTTGADEYQHGDRQWVAKAKELTDIITFPGGLDDDGEFILITAGG